jgi:hypothetical protein
MQGALDQEHVLAKLMAAPDPEMWHPDAPNAKVCLLFLHVVLVSFCAVTTSLRNITSHQKNYIIERIITCVQPTVLHMIVHMYEL